MKKVLFLITLFIFSCEDKETDSTAPTIMFTNLQESSSLTNVYDIRIDASDNKGIKEVQLFVDGVLKASLPEQSSSAYKFSFDTDEYDNGNYQMFAKAIDKSNNETNSTVLNIEFVNYRTLEIFNNTAVNVEYSYDNEPTETCYRGDTLRVDFPKKTDTIFTLFARGHCSNMAWFIGEKMNLSENESYRIFMNDAAFALFTKNNSGETIDKIEVNGFTCNRDISSGSDFFISFFDNLPAENYIRWYNKDGKYLYVDDKSNYPVSINPLDSSIPTENLIVAYNIPSYGKLEPPIPYSAKKKTNIKKLFTSTLKDQNKLNTIKGGVQKIK
tara:strand:- start:922 stop:1905 length:984 start_codon:yes stop_codon:yes gene_type:complete